ncbi:Uncharacterised protein [Bordetella pertussis]|nr:Uncharacterised protein [Bordetella pertussis]CFW47307.1 Uncharacterised protein [Bordetella pertussis]
MVQPGLTSSIPIDVLFMVDWSYQALMLACQAARVSSTRR